MHTTRNIFKKENFNMKNTGTAFYSFKKFRYLPLHIRGKRDSIGVSCLFSMYLKDKAFFVISSKVSHVPRQSADTMTMIRGRTI